MKKTRHKTSEESARMPHQAAAAHGHADACFYPKAVAERGALSHDAASVRALERFCIDAVERLS